MNFWTYQFLQFGGLFAAIYFHKALRQFKLTAFIPQLVIVCVIECLAANFKLWGLKSNYIIYQCYFLISTPVQLYLAYKMLNYKGYKSVLFITLSVSLMLFVLFDMLVLQPTGIATYTYLSVEGAIVICSFLVITTLFFEDTSTIGITEHPYFWINASNVIFGIGMLFIMGISGYIKAHKIQIAGRNIYGYVTQGLNYMLYASYIYAFVLCKKITMRQS
jgi:hypothetical protein